MKKIFKIFPVSFFLILFLFSEHIYSKEIYVVCDEPKGQRIDYETRGKKWKLIYYKKFKSKVSAMKYEYLLKKNNKLRKTIKSNNS